MENEKTDTKYYTNQGNANGDSNIRPTFVCNQCNWDWRQRRGYDGRPTICPHCKSRFWDYPKREKRVYIQKEAIVDPLNPFPPQGRPVKYPMPDLKRMESIEIPWFKTPGGAFDVSKNQGRAISFGRQEKKLGRRHHWDCTGKRIILTRIA